MGDDVEADFRFREIKGLGKLTAFDATLLPELGDIGLKQPVGAVLTDYKLGRHPMPSRSPETLDRIHTATVTGESDHCLFGMGQFGADRPGKPVPSEPPRVIIFSPGTLPGNRRPTGGELVSASSKIM